MRKICSSLKTLADRVVELDAPRQDRGRSAFRRRCGVDLVISLCSAIFCEISPKIAGRDGEIEGADALLAFVEQLLQLIPSGVRTGIDGNVEEARDKLSTSSSLYSPFLRCSLRASRANLRYSSSESGLREAPMMRVGSLNWPFVLAMIKRGKELAFGKVAGAAEHDIVEGFNGNDLAAHERLSRSGLVDGLI